MFLIHTLTPTPSNVIYCLYVLFVRRVFPVLLLLLLYMWRCVWPYVRIRQTEAAPACMAVAWEAVMAACQVDVRVTLVTRVTPPTTCPIPNIPRAICDVITHPNMLCI